MPREAERRQCSLGAMRCVRCRAMRSVLCCAMLGGAADRVVVVRCGAVLQCATSLTGQGRPCDWSGVALVDLSNRPGSIVAQWQIRDDGQASMGPLPLRQCRSPQESRRDHEISPCATGRQSTGRPVGRSVGPGRRLQQGCGLLSVVEQAGGTGCRLFWRLWGAGRHDRGRRGMPRATLVVGNKEPAKYGLKGRDNDEV